MQEPTKKTEFQKYVFKAKAVALEGSIRKPYFQDLGAHAAISTYAGSPGYVEAGSRGFALGTDISYETASSQITAQRNGEICETVATTTVTKLRVGSRFAVDEVVCRLRSSYDIRTYPKRMTPTISPAGSSIKNMSIDGKTIDVKLPTAFHMDEKQEAEYLAAGGEPGREVPGYFPEPVYVSGLGTIYVAEWTWVHPQEQTQQSLCMLRLSLGSNLGVQMNVAHTACDGQGWPPFGL